MLKYASLEILDAHMGQSNVHLRTAHRAVFDYVPREGYLYVRSRAISSRCNDNYDYFSAEEIKGNGSTTGYKTFIGKPVFVNHHNEDHRRARGVIIDAVLHEDRNPDGSPDTWAEVLMEVDAVKFPKLAQAVLAGHIDRTSMGVDVEHSTCSVCANVAKTPSDYCKHIPGMKGRRYQKVDYKTGAKTAQLIYEKCAGLRFFENSLLVEEPADPTAYVVDHPVLGPGLDHVLPRTASLDRGNGLVRDTEAFTNLFQGHLSTLGSSSSRGGQGEQFSLDHANILFGECGPRIGRAGQTSTSNHHVSGVVGAASQNPMPGVVAEGNVAGMPYHVARRNRSDQGFVTPPMRAHGGSSGVVQGQAPVPVRKRAASPQVAGMRPTAGVDAGQVSFQDSLGAYEGAPVGPADHGVHSTKIAAHQADALVMRKVKAADMSDEDLKDTDEELKRRARMLGKPGQVSKIHKTVQDELRVRKQTTGAVDPRIFDVPSNAYPGLPRITSGGVCPACRGTDTLRMEATRECVECGHLWTVAAVNPDQLIAQAAGPRYPNPADHPWFQTNPVHHSNIVSMWDKATPDEKASGRRWYPDAQLVAQALGKLHPDHPLNGGTKAQKHAYVDHPEEIDKEFTHRAAGVLATYSPQSPWTTNMHNAARALHEGKGIGGKGSGVMASQQQANSADRIMSGERYTDVLKGPKVSDFAHLIEHGGDEKADEPHVVIDRHALSVATGKRMSEEDYGSFPKTQRHYYGHVVDAYKRAADEIGSRTGEKLSGHQVQAATWLAQQRHNQAAEKAVAGQDSNADRLNKGRERARQKAEQGWARFKSEHGLDIGGEPGTGYVASRRGVGSMGNAPSLTPTTRRTAYGEQKAPADVDTLRDESCPICGESSAAYDGTNCGVCGWEAPPKMFADPDLEMARQVDLRKDVLDPTGQEGTDVGDFADESAGGLEVGEEQPDLVCDNCGTTFDAGQPQTTNTLDPEAGDRGDGPADGDICPECGAGELVPPDVLDGAEGDGELGMSPTDDVDEQGGDPNALDPSGFEQNPDVQDEEEAPEDVEEDEDSGPFPQRGDGPEDDESDGDQDEDGEDDGDEDDVPPQKAKPKTKHSLRLPRWGQRNK